MVEAMQLNYESCEIYEDLHIFIHGRAVAQAVSRWLPIAAARIRVRAASGVVVDKAALGQVFSEYPARHHSTNFSIIIITRGWHNRPIGGRSAEWTQLDSTPPLYQF
jgi:hypothetical protein